MLPLKGQTDTERGQPIYELAPRDTMIQKCNTVNDNNIVSSIRITLITLGQLEEVAYQCKVHKVNTRLFSKYHNSPGGKIIFCNHTRSDNLGESYFV